jgi:hypothetical protein
MTHDADPIDRSSYLKTTVLGLAAAVAVLAMAVLGGALLPGAAAAWVGLALALAALLPLSLALSGWIVLQRLRRMQRGAPDLFLASNATRREDALERPDGFRAGALRRWLARQLLGHDFLVGDEVEIRSLQEIEATLDERGCLGGVPFQPEMISLCGRRGRLFRSIDKIYDYGRTRGMRRLRGCVLVSGLRCDGAAHDACQARCYVIWRTEWLRRPGERASSAAPSGSGRVAPVRVAAPTEGGATRERYLCQFTELHHASTPIGEWEIGKELRPLVAGNVTARTWLIGLATRWFNLLQSLRGGTAFPPPPRRLEGAPAVEAQPLSPGDAVVVRPLAEIASTLNAKNKHRGLWFDRDQIKHCGTTRTVLARVDRIIDDAHGQMLTMKTPCILLAGVDYSGETLNFNAQHDLFFWREVWLRKAS